MTDTPVQTPEKGKSSLGQSEGKIEHLTRQQRRIMERVQQEAQNAHNQLCRKFNDFLLTCDDPSEEILREKAKQLSAQWKMFCKQKNLKDRVLNLVGDFCEKTIAEFIALQEAPKETTSIPTPEKVLESAKEDKLI